MTDTTVKPLLPGRVYDVMKAATQLWLPAAATLYFTLASIWDWPNAEAVLATAAATATFFSVVLKISNKSYEASGQRYAGTIDVVAEDEGPMVAKLDLNQDLNLSGKTSEVIFKVNTP